MDDKLLRELMELLEALERLQASIMVATRMIRRILEGESQ